MNTYQNSKNIKVTELRLRAVPSQETHRNCPAAKPESHDDRVTQPTLLLAELDNPGGRGGPHGMRHKVWNQLVDTSDRCLLSHNLCQDRREVYERIVRRAKEDVLTVYRRDGTVLEQAEGSNWPGAAVYEFLEEAWWLRLVICEFLPEAKQSKENDA